jgi:hypothetical protein
VSSPRGARQGRGAATGAHGHGADPELVDPGRGRSCRLLAKRRAKIAAGKKQMLSVLPIDLIKVVKITSIEDGLKLSGGVEEGSGTSWRSGRPGTYQVRVLAPTA